MCGRARCSVSREQVAQAAGVPADRWKDADRFHPSYNVSPGRWLPVVRKAQDGTEELQTMQWGLVPSWTKPGDKHDHYKMFNARCETIATSPVFRRLLPSKRCVMLVNGFFEWKKETGSKELACRLWNSLLLISTAKYSTAADTASWDRKQPYYIHMGEDKMMKMAGLYDVCHGEDGQPLYTFTIITCNSSKQLEWLHDRMPVIFPDDDAAQQWLESGDKLAQQLCVPYGNGLQWHPVTPEMGKPSFDGPETVEDIRQKKGAISAFFKPRATPTKAAKGTPHHHQHAPAGATQPQAQAHVMTQAATATTVPTTSVEPAPFSFQKEDASTAAGVKAEPGGSSAACNPDECDAARGTSLQGDIQGHLQQADSHAAKEHTRRAGETEDTTKHVSPHRTSQVVKAEEAIKAMETAEAAEPSTPQAPSSATGRAKKQKATSSPKPSKRRRKS